MMPGEDMSEEEALEYIKPRVAELVRHGIFETSAVSIARKTHLKMRCKTRIVTEEIDGFRYDDGKARTVIEMAESGDPDAGAALSEIVLELGKHQAPLPPNLVPFIARLLKGEYPPQQKYPKKWQSRDELLAALMDELNQLTSDRVHPTSGNKNANKQLLSICGIIRDALEANDVHMSESVLHRIWDKRGRHLEKLGKAPSGSQVAEGRERPPGR